MSAGGHVRVPVERGRVVWRNVRNGRCVVIVNNVIRPNVQLKYKHYDFETLGDILEFHIMDMQAQRVLWDRYEVIPKTNFLDISQTFFEGQKVNMISCSSEVLAIGKFKVICRTSFVKLRFLS